MMNVGEPVTITDINELISEVDRNGDGHINYEEFVAVCVSEERKPFDKNWTPSREISPYKANGKTPRRSLSRRLFTPGKTKRKVEQRL